jgi:hypothetical protein
MAELNRHDFRVLILHCFKEGLNCKECVSELVNMWGQYAPSQSTIYSWCKRFERGIYDLEDDLFWMDLSRENKCS